MRRVTRGVLCVTCGVAWQWLHKEPVAATPCKGICSVSPEMLAAAPTGNRRSYFPKIHVLSLIPNVPFILGALFDLLIYCGFLMLASVSTCRRKHCALAHPLIRGWTQHCGQQLVVRRAVCCTPHNRLPAAQQLVQCEHCALHCGHSSRSLLRFSLCTFLDISGGR